MSVSSNNKIAALQSEVMSSFHIDKWLLTLIPSYPSHKYFHRRAVQPDYCIIIIVVIEMKSLQTTSRPSWVGRRQKWWIVLYLLWMNQEMVEASAAASCTHHLHQSSQAGDHAAISSVISHHRQVTTPASHQSSQAGDHTGISSVITGRWPRRHLISQWFTRCMFNQSTEGKSVYFVIDCRRNRHSVLVVVWHRCMCCVVDVSELSRWCSVVWNTGWTAPSAGPVTRWLQRARVETECRKGVTLRCRYVVFNSICSVLLQSMHGSTQLTELIWRTIKLNKKHLRNVGPICHCEPPHAALPFTRCCYCRVACRLRIDVHNNDNMWQGGPLWPHRMGPKMHWMLMVDTAIFSHLVS